MPSRHSSEFTGPWFSFMVPKKQELMRKTLSDDRDDDFVLRETYSVTRCVPVDGDDGGMSCSDVLEAIEQQLDDCAEGSRVITDVRNATMAHGDLHDKTFSVVYEVPKTGLAFLLYFKRTKVSKTQSSPKQL